MDAKDGVEKLGRLSPAQVVQCAEGSSQVCWVQAETLDERGAPVTYECCGGAGKKARLTMKTSFLSPKSVSPDEVPDGLSWSRRFV